jgi:hypothetical protein
MELLVAIFNLTCQDPYEWDPEEPRMTFQVRPPAHFPLEGTPREPSISRFLKTNARNLAKVCRHWHTTIAGGGIPHLWETVAEFQSWKGDGTSELARFHAALARSKGSDIHVNFVSTSYDSELTDRDPQWLDPESPRARLQFHALNMVRQYKHQLKSFVVSMASLTIARFAMDLLESMAPCPRLTWVSFDSSVHEDAVAYPDISTMSLLTSLLNGSYGGIRFPNLQHTLLHGRGSTDGPNLPVSANLEHFYLRENATEIDPMSWPLIIASLNQCVSLVRLALSFRHVVDLPIKPFQIAKHNLPFVQTLIVDAHISATLPFLSSFDFPTLKFFQLTLQNTSPHPWSPHWAPILLPSVQKLRLRSASPLGSVLFGVLHLPGLQHLDTGDYTWQLDFIEPHPSHLKTPKSLLVAATGARSAAVQISRSDVSQTEMVRFQLEADSQGAPPVVDATGLPPLFNFHNLVHLSFGEFDFEDVDYLCGLLDAPRLEIMYMEVRTYDLVIEADNAAMGLQSQSRAFYERVKEVQVQRELLLECWRFPMVEVLEVDYTLYFGEEGLNQLRKDEDMSTLFAPSSSSSAPTAPMVNGDNDGDAPVTFAGTEIEMPFPDFTIDFTPPPTPIQMVSGSISGSSSMSTTTDSLPNGPKRDWTFLKSITLVFPSNPQNMVNEIALSMRRMFIAWQNRGAPLESIVLEGSESDVAWRICADDLESIVTCKKESRETVNVLAELRLSSSGTGE